MTTALVPLTAAGPLSRQWFVLAASEAVQDGPVAARLLNNDLVLWRSPNGTVIAAPDRCTHSKRPLSKGTVDGGRLVCAKHGWTFGDEGRCVLKPSGLPIAENAHLKIYPCTERYGLVWVALDDPDTELVELPWDGDERFRRIHTEVSVWRANPMQIIETLLTLGSSRPGDVTADLPFYIHSASDSDDAAQHRRLLSCAPVDGRASVVTTLVWTSHTGGNDAQIVADATAELYDARSAAEAMGIQLPGPAATPADDGTDVADWKRRLLVLVGQSA